LNGIKKIILPENAKFQQVGREVNSLKIFMKKTLDYRGDIDADRAISIRQVRNRMGCVIKKGDESILIATYGEWDTRNGGVEIELLFFVPKGIEIERKKGLSGRKSIGADRENASLAAKGWIIITATPDIDRQVEKLRKDK